MNNYLLPTLLISVLLKIACPAVAQTAQPLYTYVEQMPALLGHEEQGFIQATITRNINCPADAVRAKTVGTIIVRFVVTETGEVSDIKVVESLSAGLDAAAIDAVKHLPRFTPGRHNNEAVRVCETIPLRLNCSDGRDPTPKLPIVFDSLPADSLTRIYTYCEQPAALPGGGGVAAVTAAVVQRLVLPPNAQAGRVFVNFVVGPRGSVYNLAIVKGLNTSTDAAVLAAVRQLPRFVPARLNDRPVAVSFTIPVEVSLPKR